MKRRTGTTLIEVVVAIFIMGIGLLALLTLFPIGILTMAQAIQDERTAQAVEVLEQQASLFEGALLAGCIDAHENLSGRQDGREAIHGGERAGRLCTHPTKSKEPPKGGPQEDLPLCVDYITLHDALWRFMVVILEAILVAHHLAVELVDQFIDRSVEISVARLREHVIALDVDVALGALPAFLLLLLFHREDHPHIDHLVEMTRDPIELVRDIAAKRGSDVEVMTADRQIHE